MNIGEALRCRRGPRARRHRRLCGRHSADEGVLSWPNILTPSSSHYLNLYKMGEGPLYSFFTPYHLVHFEVPNAIARVVLFRDLVAPPLAGPVVEVCAVAKRDLGAGRSWTTHGMYMTYGEAVNVDEMSVGQYLPEGLVEGCKLQEQHREGCGHHVSTTSTLPAGRLADKLRAEQYKRFRGEIWLEEIMSVPA